MSLKANLFGGKHRSAKPKSFRLPRGYFTRRYVGGELDGRTDLVPVNGEPIKKWVNKASWTVKRGRFSESPNYYVLAEPAAKPRAGEVFIYEYKKSFRPSPEQAQGALHG